jgi:hypothetical protein
LDKFDLKEANMKHDPLQELTKDRFSIVINRLFTNEEFAKLKNGYIGDQDSK